DLGYRCPEAAARFVQALENPASYVYSQPRSLAAFDNTFGPLASTVQSLAAYFSAEGVQFVPTGRQLDYRVIGNAASIDSAFHTVLWWYSINGTEAIGALGGLQVPASLAGDVSGLITISDYSPEKVSVLQLHAPPTPGEGTGIPSGIMFSTGTATPSVSKISTLAVGQSVGTDSRVGPAVLEPPPHSDGSIPCVSPAGLGESAMLMEPSYDTEAGAQFPANAQVEMMTTVKSSSPPFRCRY
ncbi:MAG: hypothetical protein KGI89_17240, partial [Euryarchaeota archaeon]|nr:hypothetical protein [Euryarchaeota archaeon]